MWDVLSPFLCGAVWAWLLSENYRASADARAEAKLQQTIKMRQALERIAKNKDFMERMSGAAVDASLEFSINGKPFRAIVERLDGGDA